MFSKAVKKKNTTNRLLSQFLFYWLLCTGHVLRVSAENTSCWWEKHIWRSYGELLYIKLVMNIKIYFNKYNKWNKSVIHTFHSANIRCSFDYLLL